VCHQRRIQRHPGEAKCVTEIPEAGEEQKYGMEVRGKCSRLLCLKCSKTHVQASLIPKFYRGDTQTSVIREGAEGNGERGELKGIGAPILFYSSLL